MIKIDKNIKKITGENIRCVYADKALYSEELILCIKGTEKSKTWTIHDVKEFVEKLTAIEFMEEKAWTIPTELLLMEELPKEKTK